MKKNFKNFIKLITLTKAKKSYLIFLVFLMLVSSFADILSLALMIPYVSQILNFQDNSTFFLILEFDSLKKFSQQSLTFFLTILLIIIFFLKAVLSILIRWMISSFSFLQYAKLQVIILNLYQNMKYEDHISRSTIDYIKSIRELCRECNSNVELNLRILSETIILFAIIVFLAFVNYKILILLFLIILPIFLFYEIVLKPINIKLGTKQTHAMKGLYNIIDNSMRGFKETRILKKELFFQSKLKIFVDLIYRTQKIAVLISDSPRYVFEFFIAFISLLVIYIVSKNFDLNNFVPIISAYIVATIRLLPSISYIAGSLSRISSSQFAVSQIINDVTFLKNNSVSKSNEKISAEQFKNLRFKNVYFFYENTGIQVLENINFELKKNDCVGIMGASGVGKTTFIDIMLGLLKPQKGEILINDKSVDDFGVNFQENIAYLPQEPVILDETISTNITLEIGEKINFERLQDAIKQANFDKVVENLPKKIETRIGDDGVRLSGGQNKRLALSRAFYHGKKIFIMDEGTSSLDFDTENYIAEEIRSIKGKRTIIIISHNNNILKYCDRIYLIKDRSIQLLEKHEKYIK